MDGTFGLVCQSKWSSVMCDYHSLAKQYLLEWSLKLSCSENNSRVVERHNQWNTSMEDQSFACCSTKSTWRHNHHATITVMSSHPLVWPNHLYKSYPVIFVLYTLVLRSSVEGGPSSRLQVEVCGEECGRPAFRMCIMNSLPNAHAHLLVVIMSVIVSEPDPSSWSGSKTIYTYAHFCVWICACAGCFPHDVKVILPMFTLPYIPTKISCTFSISNFAIGAGQNNGAFHALKEPGCYGAAAAPWIIQLLQPARLMQQRMVSRHKQC